MTISKQVCQSCSSAPNSCHWLRQKFCVLSVKAEAERSSRVFEQAFCKEWVWDRPWLPTGWNIHQRLSEGNTCANAYKLSAKGSFHIVSHRTSHQTLIWTKERPSAAISTKPAHTLRDKQYSPIMTIITDIAHTSLRGLWCDVVMFSSL